jgi:hypothetical protein
MGSCRDEKFGSPGLVLALILLERRRATNNAYNPDFTHHNPIAVAEVDVRKREVDVPSTVVMVPRGDGSDYGMRRGIQSCFAGWQLLTSYLYGVNVSGETCYYSK